jgi:hypothetical protein
MLKRGSLTMPLRLTRYLPPFLCVKAWAGTWQLDLPNLGSTVQALCRKELSILMHTPTPYCTVSMQVLFQAVHGPEEVERWMNPYNALDNNSPVKLPVLLEISATAAMPDGMVAGSVLQRTPGSIEVKIPPDLESGYYLPIVIVGRWGAAQYPSNSTDITVFVAGRIDTVSPKKLSYYGGVVTLTGTGFPTDPSRFQLFGYGATWTILHADPTTIVAFSGYAYQEDSFQLMPLQPHPADAFAAPPNPYYKQGYHGTYCRQSSCMMSLSWNGEYLPRVLSILPLEPDSGWPAVDISSGEDIQMKMSVPHSGNLTNDSIMLLLNGQHRIPVNMTILDEYTVQVVVAQSSLASLPGTNSFHGHQAKLMVDGSPAFILDSYPDFMLRAPLSISGISSTEGEFQLVAALAMQHAIPFLYPAPSHHHESMLDAMNRPLVHRP